jgi:hypothetical protein
MTIKYRRVRYRVTLHQYMPQGVYRINQIWDLNRNKPLPLETLERETPIADTTWAGCEGVTQQRM